MSKATTQRRTTSQRDDLVTAASTFGTRVTTNGTLMNRVDVRGAGSRQIAEQHRGVRELSALVRFEPRATGARDDQGQRDATPEALNRHGWNFKTMPSKLVALPCTVAARGPLVKLSK